MNTNTSTSPATEKKEKKTGSVAFILSLLFHGGILLMIGGIVLIPAVVQKSAFTADPNMVVPTDIQMDEPPDAAQDQNDLPPSQAPQENMQLSETPAPAAQNDLFVAREDTGASASSWAGLAASAPVDIKTPKFDKKDESPIEEEAQKQKKMSVGSRVTLFGSTEKTSTGGLEGYLYDLKQSPDRKPNEMKVTFEKIVTFQEEKEQMAAYGEVVNKFVKSGFRTSVLSKYYKVPEPMYLSYLWVPFMNANEAPKAFNVEKEVQPRRWIIHYKGKISPPATGKYRLNGFTDDMMFVAIDGNVVLHGSVRGYGIDGMMTWYKPTSGRNIKLGYGKWVNLVKDKVYNIDIVIGEDPGGSFASYLLVEKEGEKYAMDDGIPVLPLLRFNKAPVKLTDEQVRKFSFKFLKEGMIFAPAE